MKITGKKYAVGTVFVDKQVRNGIERTRWFTIKGYNKKGQMKVVTDSQMYYFKKDGIDTCVMDDQVESYLLSPYFGDCWACFLEVFFDPKNIIDDTID